MTHVSYQEILLLWCCSLVKLEGERRGEERNYFILEKEKIGLGNLKDCEAEHFRGGASGPSKYSCCS